MTEQQNRRRFPRFPAGLALLVRRLGEAEAENLAKTQVVGLGGCLFLHPEPLGLGETVELMISAKGSVITAKARVAYEMPRDDGKYEIGVEFLALSEEDKEKLLTVLQREESSSGAGPGQTHPGHPGES